MTTNKVLLQVWRYNVVSYGFFGNRIVFALVAPTIAQVLMWKKRRSLAEPVIVTMMTMRQALLRFHLDFRSATGYGQTSAQQLNKILLYSAGYLLGCTISWTTIHHAIKLYAPNYLPTYQRWHYNLCNCKKNFSQSKFFLAIFTSSILSFIQLIVTFPLFSYLSFFYLFHKLFDIDYFFKCPSLCS